MRLRYAAAVVRRLLLTNTAVLLLAMALVAPACRNAKPSRCERVCDRQAQCASDLKQDQHNDEAECVEQCGKLERDAKRAVDEHVACVDSAGNDCRAVLACP